MAAASPASLSLTPGFLPAQLSSPTQKYKFNPFPSIFGFTDKRTCHILLRVNKSWKQALAPFTLPLLATENRIPSGGKEYRIMRSFTRAQIHEIAKVGLVIPFPAGEKILHFPRLAQGNFGEFCIARELGKEKWCGVKITKGDQAIDAEAMIQKTLRGRPHILSADSTYKAISPTGEVTLYQFMALAGLGSTDKLLPILSRCDAVFNEQALSCIGRAMFIGLISMHASGFCHLDMKPQNIAVGETVQLIDFGCSAPLRGLDIRKKNGDMDFYSPERWLAERFSEYPECDGIKVDAWAAGMTLLILAGHDAIKLFSQMKKIAFYKGKLDDIRIALSQYVHGQLTTIESLCMPPKDSFWELIKNLLHPDPSKRISPTVATLHPWIKNMAPKKRYEQVIGYLRESVQVEQAACPQASLYTVRSPQDLPLPEWSSYIGRGIQKKIDEYISDLSSEAYAKEAPQLVIKGKAGVGKSHLLTHLIHHGKTKYEFDLRLWFRQANKPELLEEQYRILARELGLIETGGSAEDAIREVHHYLNTYHDRHHGKHWIAVFDDAVSLTSLAPYLPKSGGQILITTCSTHWKNAMGMDVMSEAGACALVEKLLMRKDPHALELCTALFNLPLAIVKACAYIRSYPRPLKITEFISCLKGRRELLDEGDQLFGKKIPDHVTHVWSTIRFSILENLPNTMVSNPISFLSNKDRASTASASRSLHKYVKQVPVAIFSVRGIESLIPYIFVKRHPYAARYTMSQVLETVSKTPAMLDQLRQAIASQFAPSLTAVPTLTWIFDLKREFPAFNVIDESVWENYTNLADLGIDPRGAEPITPEMITTLRGLLTTLLPLVEEGAGVTLLTLPRGLTIEKLNLLASKPSGKTPPLEIDGFKSMWGQFGNIPVNKTHRVLIMNGNMKETRSLPVDLQRELVIKKGYVLPTILSFTTLAILTHVRSFSEPYVRLFPDHPKTWALCSEEFDKSPINFGSFSNKGPRIRPYGFAVDRERGIALQRTL